MERQSEQSRDHGLSCLSAVVFSAESIFRSLRQLQRARWAFLVGSPARATNARSRSLASYVQLMTTLRDPMLSTLQQLQTLPPSAARRNASQPHALKQRARVRVSAETRQVSRSSKTLLPRPFGIGR